MKITKKILSAAVALGMGAFFFSCGSTATLDSSAQKTEAKTEQKKKDPNDEPPLDENSAKTIGSVKSVGASAEPKRLTEAPKFDFTGNSLQIELENMYYDGFDLVNDKNASGAWALKLLNDSSWAIAEVNFPAGSYEAVANVLAPDSNHTRFTLYVNKDTYLIYGSEPPIGKYELTTRAPASFTLDQPTTVTVKIQQNDIRNPANAGHNGMTIDYLSFKKLDPK